MARSGHVIAWMLVLLAACGVLVLVLMWRKPPPEHGNSIGGDTSRSETWLEALQQRYAHRQGNDAASVIVDAEKAIVRDPEHVPLLNFLAMMLSESGRTEEAYGHMLASLERNPAQTEIHFGAGVLATQLDRLDAALNHYTVAVRQAPDQAAYRVHLAMVKIKQQEDDVAEQLLLQAIQLDSNFADGYYGLAELYFMQNKLQLSLQQIEKAIERMPVSQRAKQVKLLRKKAWILRRWNRWADALVTLKRLTPGERRQRDVLDEVAVCLGQLGRPDEAAKQYEEAWAHKPLDAELVAGAARWRLAHGDRDQARQHLATLRMLAPTSPVLEELKAKLGSQPLAR